MAVKIQFRRDTSANWTSANPTLSEGELGLETNTGRFKLGNGSSAWNSLDYVYGRSVLNGTSDPQSQDGVNGDFWINTTTHALFGPKSGGTWPGSGTSLVGEMVNDTTPQLGGDMDVNGRAIVSASNGNIAITPNGTGEVRPGKTNLQDNQLLRPEIRDYSETVNAMGNCSGSRTIDLELGNVVTATTTGTTTWTFSNPPASGRAGSFILVLTNGGSAAQTWPSGIKWPGGTAPVLTSSGVDMLSFFTLDGGTTWRGCLTQKDSR